MKNTKQTLTLKYWQCALLVAVGLATLFSRAAMDVYQGANTMTWWTAEWGVQVWQMVLPSIYVLTFSCVVGTAIRYRAWLVSGFLLAGITVFLFFTSLNNLDFITSQTVAKVAAAKAKAEQAKDIADIRNEEAIKERREIRDNLWRTYTVARRQDEKERILEQIKKVTDAPLELQAVAVEPVKDAGSILERWTKIKASTWAELKALTLPIGFMVCEIFAIALGVGAWPRKSEQSPVDGPGDGESFTADTKTPGKLQVLTGGKVSPARRYETAEARKDLQRMLGEAPTVDKASLLASRWNWSLPTVLRQLERWEAEGVCRSKKDGRDRVIMRPGPKAIQSTA